jgi:hypothetical protein
VAYGIPWEDVASRQPPAGLADMVDEADIPAMYGCAMAIVGALRSSGVDFNALAEHAGWDTDSHEFRVLCGWAAFEGLTAFMERNGWPRWTPFLPVNWD